MKFISFDCLQLWLLSIFYFRRCVFSIGVNEQLWMEVVAPSNIAYMYKIRAAKDFGSFDRFNFRTVEMGAVEPAHGCSQLLSNGISLHGKIALIKRGECSFLTKVYNVEMYGAIAAIIYNNLDEYDKWIDMIGDGTDRNSQVGIPAFFLRGKDGQMITDSLQGHRSNAIINLPINATVAEMHRNQPPWQLF